MKGVKIKRDEVSRGVIIMEDQIPKFKYPRFYYMSVPTVIYEDNRLFSLFMGLLFLRRNEL